MSITTFDIYSTKRLPEALQWGWIPKPSEAFSGLWTRIPPILNVTLNIRGVIYEENTLILVELGMKF